EDDVAIAKKDVTAGTVLEDGPTRITVRLDIKPGHKVARRAVSARQPVRRYGGTGVLAETPEIYGAEHLLIRRAINEGVAKKLIDRYKWWEWYCRGIEAMDNNPAPGNKAGGITTVFEKSLGGVTKG